MRSSQKSCRIKDTSTLPAIASGRAQYGSRGGGRISGSMGAEERADTSRRIIIDTLLEGFGLTDYWAAVSVPAMTMTYLIQRYRVTP